MVCLNCSEEIPKQVFIDGKLRSLHNRKYCLDCSPFNGHNVKSLHLCKNKPLNLIGDWKFCYTCNQWLPSDECYRTKCKKCFNDNIREKKRLAKLEFIDILGGKCQACGYSNPAGLDFHHINPNEKKFIIPSWSRHAKIQVYEELKKCKLLCVNCHKEFHYPHTILKDQVDLLYNEYL